MAGVALLLPAAAQEPSPTIDACLYADDAAARAAWEPMGATAPAATDTRDGLKVLRLRCNFAGTTIERASWDRRVDLDLGACRGVQFRLFCRDASPVSYFMLYFQSGDGWYSATFFPEAPGWNTVTLDKADTNIEGRPAGWGRIRTLRFSAWRGGDTDTEVLLSDLRMTGMLGTDTQIALVRCDSAAQGRPDETRSVQRYSAAVARSFEDLGVGCATLSDSNLTAAQLQRAKLVVLPHNPTMPDAAAEELARYLEGGGRLLTFYGMPARLRSVAHIDAGEHVRPAQAGGFAVMRFKEEVLPGAPLTVTQKSWNILEPKPLAGASRVAAEWLDAQGQPAGRAAVVVSSNCVEVSHVALDEDPASQRRMLLAMAGYLAPAIWQQAADASLARVGRLAGWAGFDEAAAQIAAAGGDNPRVAALLGEARRLRENARRLRDDGRFAPCCDQAALAAERALDAFCAAQRPVADEFRGFWCHSAFGVPGMDWDAAVERLAENGLSAILPNLLWGGVAYYPSEVLPPAPEVASKGDQVAQCLAACRKQGVQIHVWKVNWNLGRAPREFVERLRREGRLQANSNGKEEPWLCPSHPDNAKLEIDSMVEVARRYAVDGLHFDYIRYPDDDHCFCAGCRERFQRAAGLTLARWPQDVLTGCPQRKAWLDWRRDTITAVVKAVSEQARAVRPSLKLSAAVFRNWPMDRDSVGQDWKLWCERGYLDFVCPMDYTASDAQFENSVRHQLEWAGRTPCYPGIGAWVLAPDRVIGQIQIARRHDTKGFVLFNYDAGAAGQLVPRLGQGITRKTGRNADREP